MNVSKCLFNYITHYFIKAISSMISLLSDSITFRSNLNDGFNKIKRHNMESIIIKDNLNGDIIVRKSRAIGSTEDFVIRQMPESYIYIKNKNIDKLIPALQKMKEAEK